MKTFKQYLAEKQEAHSIASSILYGDPMPPFFLTPTMMKRLDYTIENVTAFHITAQEFVENLLKLQGKKNTQLSVMLRLNANEALEGIETSGGIVAELKGQIDAYFSTDAFTGLLKGGRRSVQIHPMSDFGGSVQRRYKDIIGTNEAAEMIKAYLSDFRGKLLVQRAMILDRHITPFLAKTFPEAGIRKTDGFFEAFEKVQLTNDPLAEGLSLDELIRAVSGGRQVYNKIVTEYLDAQEKIIKSNPHYKKLFLMPMNTAGDKDVSGGYDEAIMSNFRITKLHAYNNYATSRGATNDRDNKALDDYASSLSEDFGVEAKPWYSMLALIRYINKTGTDISDILKKKVSS